MNQSIRIRTYLPILMLARDCYYRWRSERSARFGLLLALHCNIQHYQGFAPNVCQ